MSRNASSTQLSQRAAKRKLLLVPGVMSPSEVHQARRLGCRIVKLFPAVSVGISHWRSAAGRCAALAGGRGGCGGAGLEGGDHFTGAAPGMVQRVGKNRKDDEVQDEVRAQTGCRYQMKAA